MAIEYNNASSGDDSEVSSLTFSHTVNAGSNKILIVGVTQEDAAGGGGTLELISGITYDDVALTKIASQLFDSNNNSVELWYLLNPNEGTANVVVTLGEIVDGVSAGAITINGAKQQAPEVNETASGAGVTASVTITTLTNNAWIIDCVCNSSSTDDMTVGSGQTERWEDSNNQRGNGSTKPVVTAGETSVSWTDLDADRPWAIVAASFEEAVSGYTISAEAGSYAETGSVVSLLRDGTISIGAGSFTWTGFAATLAKTVHYILEVLAGVFALVGSSVTLKQKDGDYTIPRPVETEHTELVKPETEHTEKTKPDTDYVELTKTPTDYSELEKPTTNYEEE